MDGKPNRTIQKKWTRSDRYGLFWSSRVWPRALSRSGQQTPLSSR